MAETPNQAARRMQKEALRKSGEVGLRKAMSSTHMVYEPVGDVYYYPRTKKWSKSGGIRPKRKKSKY